MDLHRIPDDLSIPEFLKRDRRRMLSDYEKDDSDSRKQINTARLMADEYQKRKGEKPKSLLTPPCGCCTVWKSPPAR